MYSSPKSKAWNQVLKLCRENGARLLSLSLSLSLSMYIYIYILTGVTLHLFLVDVLTSKCCCSFAVGVELNNGISTFLKEREQVYGRNPQQQL